MESNPKSEQDMVTSTMSASGNAPDTTTIASAVDPPGQTPGATVAPQNQQRTMEFLPRRPLVEPKDLLDLGIDQTFKNPLMMNLMFWFMHKDQCHSRPEHQTKFPDGCTFALCEDMIKLVEHGKQCTDSNQCMVVHCAASKRILAHCETCTEGRCSVCAALGCKRRWGKKSAGMKSQPKSEKDKETPTMSARGNAPTSTIPTTTTPLASSTTQAVAPPGPVPSATLAPQKGQRTVGFLPRRPLVVPKELVDLGIEQPDANPVIGKLRFWFMHKDHCYSRKEHQAAFPGGCTIEMCEEMIELLEHGEQCTAGNQCRVADCAPSKRLLDHCETCIEDRCTVCAALGCRMCKSAGRTWSSNKGATASLSAVTTGVESSEKPQNSGGTLADEIKTERDRLLFDEWKRQSDIEVYRASHDLLRASQTDISPTGPQLMAPRQWHAVMAMSDFVSASSLRSEKMRKLLDALCPNNGPPVAGHPRMATLIAYVRKVEGKIYQRSISADEYARLIAAKMDTAATELEAKRQRIVELCQVGTTNPSTLQAERKRAISSAVMDLAAGYKSVCVEEQETWISRLCREDPTVTAVYVERRDSAGSDSGTLMMIDLVSGNGTGMKIAAGSGHETVMKIAAGRGTLHKPTGTSGTYFGSETTRDAAGNASHKDVIIPVSTLAMAYNGATDHASNKLRTASIIGGVAIFGVILFVVVYLLIRAWA